jgi:hypothetical protein
MALCAALVASPDALVAQEYYNLDAGRPTRVEDATPTPRQELDIQMPALRFDQLQSGPKVWRADSKLSYGVAAFTEIELRVPLLLVDPGDVRAPRTIGLGGLAIGATRALTLESGALPAVALTGEWVAPVGGLSARVGSYGVKLLATKTFSFARFNLNAGYGTWSIRAAPVSVPTSCPPIVAGVAPPAGCSGTPPVPPVTPCARIPSDEARFACLPGAPTTSSEALRARSMADTTLAALTGPRYTAGLGVDHAFALSSTLVIADVVVERYVDLYDDADVIAELGLRHQLAPQVVVDVGVSRHFAAPVRGTSITLGLSFDMPMQQLLPWGSATR